MKKNTSITMILAIVLTASLTGCGMAADISTDPTTSVSTTAEAAQTAGTAKAESLDDTITVQQLSYTEGSDSVFTKRDLAQTADTSDAQYITVSDSATVDITQEGVYVIRGSAQNCTIRINADENAKIQLVLDGVSITNSDFPAIYVLSADKVFVTTTGSENSLTVSGQFRADGDTNTDAVIYSKDDLVLNGTGTLNVTSGYGNGITCKDDMKITGGTYDVRCKLDAFEANDSIAVSDGTFSIETDKDGFHCGNDKAEGTITIYGGTFSIQGGSDGMQACALLQIDGGTIDITASEGLEATYVRINDGSINIQASDDGINASSSTNAYETAVEINGGSVTVAVGQGDTDAIDSNGSIYVNGGTIDITAQMSSFDYDVKAEFNGGTIIINGTEVSEIPQSMMGGGMHGGMGGMRDGRNGAPDDAPSGAPDNNMNGDTNGNAHGGMHGRMHPGSGEGGLI